MKKENYKIGDYVEIFSEKENLKGTILPSTNKEILTLKLNSGYNLGIEKNKIKKINLIKKISEKKENQEKVDFKKGLKTISILHTGGTIASKVDYETGGVISKFTPEEFLSIFPELKEIANFKSKLVRKMWSDDLRFKHFGVLAKEIENEIKSGVEGVIVGMGTDNLAVASAALSFVLESCPVPVILVASQRSSDRGSSDAAMNLVCASLFITKTDFSGVAICMHDSINDKTCSIFPACKTRKMHTSRRDAFKPINDNVIAQVDYRTKNINFIKEDYKRKGEKLVIKDKFEEKVALIKITINMTANQFLAYKGYKGLIIEGTGLGHTPGDVIDNETKEHAKIKKALQDLNKSMVVVMTSQCLFGRVNMNVYSKGRDLQEIGIISGEDMLPEVAFVKLAWLLGNYNPKEVKGLIGKNLRGEINDHLTKEFLD